MEKSTAYKWYITAPFFASMTRWALLLLVAGFLLVSATSCKKDKIAANVRTFSIPAFKANLNTQIMNSAATTPRGFSFVINKDGWLTDSLSFGSASFNATGGGLNPMHTNYEINIASVSKTMTAVAVYQLLKKNTLTIKSKIGEWLPAYWNAKQAIRDLTFEELMTHSSGLLEGNTSYDSLKATVFRGLDNPAKPFDAYANINFALFRVMIPYLNDKNQAVQQENNLVPGNTSQFETWLSDKYIEYMQNKVFSPISMGTVTCTPSSNSAQAFGETNGVGASSVTVNDWRNLCGGGGYFMSVKQMARFMAYVSHTYDILDKDARTLMDNQYMGWDNEDSPMTSAGRAYGKDGALWWDLNNNNVQEQGEPGLQTLVMKFPNGVELSLAINSIPGAYRNLSNLVRIAYEGAWSN